MRFLAGLLLWVLLLACAQQEQPPTASLSSTAPAVDSAALKLAAFDSTHAGQYARQQHAGRWVEFFVPEGGASRTLLVLPGWKFPARYWCDSTRLCSLAEQMGYRLVLPEMHKSIYASTLYPQTRADWRKEPTRTWLTDSLLPALHDSFGLFAQGYANGLLGLSTGARGVALVALHTTDDSLPLFQAGVALSGDYDQRAMPRDNLMRGWYGEMGAFADRWAGPDNPAVYAAGFRTALYLGHGLNDAVVPWQQTQLFYDTLKAKNPNLPVQLNLQAGAAHTFVYWDGELDAAFAFMEEHFH